MANDDDILFDTEEYAEMHPALDVAQDALHVAVLANTKSNGPVPYLLTSRGDDRVEAARYDSQLFRVLKTQGLDLSYATPQLRWTGDGLRQALSGEPFDVPTFPEAFQAIRGKLAEYLVTDEQHLDVAALFVMLTYFHPLFDKLPILWCYALQGVGKSRLAEAVAYLSFNGMVSGTATRSTIFRTADAGRYTQALTEMDVLTHTHTGDALATDFHGCTSQGEAWVMVSEQEKGSKHKPNRYYGYAPRVLCTTADIKSSPLKSRCIRLDFTPTAHPDWDKLDKSLWPKNPDFAPVRDLLYRLQLGNWTEVVKGYQTIKQAWRDADAPRGRTRDKWLPLYTLAVLSGDEQAVATVRDMAANDPYDTQKSRGDSLDAYLMMFAGWLTAKGDVELTRTQLWEAFTQGYHESAWAAAVGLHVDVDWLKRSKAGGAQKLVEELDRVKVLRKADYRKKADNGYHTLKRLRVYDVMRNTLGDDVATDCERADPVYQKPGEYCWKTIPDGSYREEATGASLPF